VAARYRRYGRRSETAPKAIGQRRTAGARAVYRLNSATARANAKNSAIVPATAPTVRPARRDASSSIAAASAEGDADRERPRRDLGSREVRLVRDADEDEDRDREGHPRAEVERGEGALGLGHDACSPGSPCIASPRRSVAA